MEHNLRTYKLSNLYSAIPRFSEFVEKAFGKKLISKDWLAEVKKIRPGNSVLEIGAGHGRFTEILIKTKASITAIEPDPYFNFAFRRNPRLKKASNVRLLKAFFPFPSKEKYDYILLHQNVFLELINEMPLHRTIQSLKKFLKPKGMVILDYVWPFTPDTKREKVIYRHNAKNFGQVKYSYRYILPKLQFYHRVELYFSISKKGGAKTSKFQLRFWLPPWSRIASEVVQSGGKVSKKTMKDYSFFPGTLILGKFRF